MTIGPVKGQGGQHRTRTPHGLGDDLGHVRRQTQLSATDTLASRTT
jgi:hypothetical protein